MMTSAPSPTRRSLYSTVAQLIAMGAVGGILAEKSCHGTRAPRPIQCQQPQIETIVVQPRCGNAKVERVPEYRGHPIPQAATAREGVYWNTTTNKIVTPATNGSLPRGTVRVVARGYPETEVTCAVDFRYGPGAPEHPCFAADVWLPNYPNPDGQPIFYYVIYIDENAAQVAQPDPTRSGQEIMVNNPWFRAGTPGQTSSICPPQVPVTPSIISRPPRAIAARAREVEEPEPTPASNECDRANVAACPSLGVVRNAFASYVSQSRDDIRNDPVNADISGTFTLTGRFSIGPNGRVHFIGANRSGRNVDVNFTLPNTRSCDDLRSCNFSVGIQVTAPNTL